jgi:hypothetical protein
MFSPYFMFDIVVDIMSPSFCTRCAYHLRMLHPPGFSPGVSSPLFSFWNRLHVPSFCTRHAYCLQMLHPPAFSPVLAHCCYVESPCFFLLVLAHRCCNLPSIHLFPQTPIVPLCCAKSLLTSYFGCFVDPASVPWNYNVAYQWVFDLVVFCGGHLLPPLLKCHLSH